MSPATTVEDWALLPGWGSAYEVELHSGRCRSVDRYAVNVLGTRRWLRGRELVACGDRGVVTLSHNGARRNFTARQLQAMAVGS